MLSKFLVNILSLTQAASKYYDGEIRPYEFGFNIEGNQHRHETKDARGVIMGEFGFITADNVYHVTVYATDENGDFKVLSMKNIKIGLYQVMANLQEMKNLKSTVIKNSDTPTCSSCGIPERKKQTVTDKPLSSGNIFDQGTTTNHPTSDKPNKISQIVQGTQEKTGVQESQRSYGSKGGSGVQGIQRIGGLQSTKTVPNSHDEVIQGGHGGQDAQGISVIQSPRELQEQRTPETQEIRKLQELQKFQGIKGLKSSQVHSGIQRTEGGRDTPEMQVTYRPQEIQGQRTPETKNVQKTHIPQGAQGGKETQQGKQVQITHLVKDSKESEHSKGQQGIQKIQGGQVAQILQGAQPFQGKQTLKEPKETQGGSQSSPESSGSLEQPVPPFRYLSKGFDTVNDERMQEMVKILNGITQTIQQLNSSQENNLQSADKGVPNQILRNVDEKSKAEENFQYKERGPINSAMISNNSAKIGNQAKSVNANINTNKVLMNPAISRNNQNIDRGSLNIQISSNNPESKDFQTTSDRVHQNEGKDLIIPTVLANKLSNPNTKDQNQNKKLPTINIKALEDMMDNILGDLYKFNYTVGYHGHHEHGDRSGKKEGGYYFVGRDGLERIVDYIANEFGFQPHIKLQPAKMENIPREETEKEAGLQGYEFKWFKL